MVLIMMYGKVIIHKKFKKTYTCIRYVINYYYICNNNIIFMITHFKHLFQTIIYFIVESSITAILVFIVCNIFFRKYIDYNIKLIELISGIFIIKITLSNLLSIVSNLDKEHALKKRK